MAPFIGHLQTNKVKYIAPFVSMIHSVDSLKLAKEIDTQAVKNNRVIPVLLQAYVASEETKFGLDEAELLALLRSGELQSMAAYPHQRADGYGYQYRQYRTGTRRVCPAEKYF